MVKKTVFKNINQVLWDNFRKKFELEHVSKKLSIGGGVVYGLQHYLTPKRLKQVYCSITCPHKQFAITSWGKAPASYINKF